MDSMVFEIVQLPNGDFALRERNTKEPVIHLRFAGVFTNEQQELKQHLVKHMFHAAIKSLGETPSASLDRSALMDAMMPRDRIECQIQSQNLTKDDDKQINKDLLNFYFARQFGEVDVEMERDLSRSRTLH